MQKLIDTFLALAALDEVHPNEDKVLEYIKKRLTDAGVPFKQDKMGNIVGRVKGKSDEALAMCGHVDIAAPLNGRKVIVTDETIKTDGKGLLGGDDKTAVAAMLELADYIHAEKPTPPRTLELVFTVGEESGLVGAINFDMAMLTARHMLVFDWTGTPAEIIQRSPAIYKIDVEYIGKDAHPAEWQKGKNAGAALIQAASELQQGEYAPGVTFNIGRMEFGDARNKVPGFASLKAEARGFDTAKINDATQTIISHFEQVAQQAGITANVTLDDKAVCYNLDESSQLLAEVKTRLIAQGLTPRIVETYGGFDANIFASHGIEAVILGAGFYNPHSPDEYINIPEFTKLYQLVKSFAD